MFVKAQRVRRNFKVALIGKWKTGKTRAALSFPAPAVVDTHRGTDLYDQYDYDVSYAQTWREMEGEINWLRANAEKKGIKTFVLDDASTIYDDLINEVSIWRQNKSGSGSPLNTGDWGVIKRRWKEFLKLLPGST
jgi:hypothetical protein